MTKEKKLTPKVEIMQQLFENTTAAFPSALITEIGERLLEERSENAKVITTYNHNAPNVTEACGISEERCKQLHTRLCELVLEDKQHKRLSQVMETLEKENYSKQEITFMMIQFFIRAFQSFKENLKNAQSNPMELIKIMFGKK
jgi:hypothetical protein